MLENYVRNYWSLYVDFLKDFSSLTYRGFTLSYILHFSSLIRHHDQIWEDLNDEKFQHRLKTNIKHEREVQEIFNQYLQKHNKKTDKKICDGKVAIFEDAILHFPHDTFAHYFKRSNTIILLNSDHQKTKYKYGIPVVNLFELHSDTKQAILKLQSEAKLIFKYHHSHHLYRDLKFRKLFLKKIADVVQCIERCKLLLETIPISCIVVSNTHSYISRILSLAAMEKGIPTISMQHGIIANGFGYLPKICNINAVYGNFEVEWYTSRGISRDSLAIIGHPRFDQIFSYPSMSRSKFHQQLGLDNDKKTLLIVVRGNRDMMKWRTFINAIVKQLDVNIVIRDFPNMEPHLLTEEFPFVQSTRTIHLYDILSNVDYVISYQSTVGLEAMLFHKPVFILKRRVPNDTGYFDMLDEFVQKDPIKLAEMVVKYVNRQNPCRERDFWLFSKPYLDRSMSGLRLKRLIDKLTKKI